MVFGQSSLLQLLLTGVLTHQTSFLRAWPNVQGACYGKPEALALFFVTPVLLLGHLTGLVPQGGEKGLLLTFVALCTIFAGRKWTQAIKDDIGDKSVFM